MKDNKKRKNHRNFLTCAIYDEVEFPNYLDKPLTTKHKHDEDNKEKKDEEKVEVPLTLVYGVTVSLVGFFVMILPFPGCKDWGVRIMMMGISATGGVLSNQAEQNRKNEKDKKNK
jgi:hypothetical protein